MQRSEEFTGSGAHVEEQDTPEPPLPSGCQEERACSSPAATDLNVTCCFKILLEIGIKSKIQPCWVYDYYFTEMTDII